MVYISICLLVPNGKTLMVSVLLLKGQMNKPIKDKQTTNQSSKAQSKILFLFPDWLIDLGGWL